MQYIILSDGKGSRWNNYMGITKQEAIIDGERIIDRTCRLLRDNNQKDVKVLSSNPNHSNNLSVRIESDYENVFMHEFAYDYLNQETTFLFGDTYYEEDAITQIIKDKPEDVMFYGNETAIVGVKVVDLDLFKKVIGLADDPEKFIYHYFKHLDGKYRFKSVGRTFTNINTSEDYERLKKLKEQENKRLLKDD